MVSASPAPDTQKWLQEQRPMLSGHVVSDMAKMDVSLIKSVSVQGTQSPEVTSLCKRGVLFLFFCRLTYNSTNIQIVCHTFSLSVS